MGGTLVVPAKPCRARGAYDIVRLVLALVAALRDAYGVNGADHTAHTIMFLLGIGPEVPMLKSVPPLLLQEAPGLSLMMSHRTKLRLVMPSFSVSCSVAPGSEGFGDVIVVPPR